MSIDFASTNAPSSDISKLEPHIKSLIHLTGPISMLDYMNMVIQYYYKHSSDVQNDFITAPEVSQMFGECIALWILSIWHKIGTDKSLHIIELGPGNGTLMYDILRSTRGFSNFHDAIKRITFVEISPSLRERQHAACGSFKPRLDFVDDIAKVKADRELFCIVIANEFFDVLPINQYKYFNNSMHNVVIGLDKASNLAKFTLPISPAKAHKLTQTANHEFVNDDILEEHSSYDRIASELSGIVKNRGACLLIDYGYEKSDYKNTIQALYKHKRCDILDNIGRADITSHVNFGHIVEKMKEDIKESKLCTQRHFLLEHGVQERYQKLRSRTTNTAKIDRQLHRLIDKEQMGSLFKVLSLVNY